ncbi:hypothetical protein E4T44_05332 [Aureobasidium sp. EXF-8845]|nr:hypothetical protein E4T44_05332 [Aureobasidium sp. EXF-8845]KAI4850968.1 hypothetical protein E4T45_05275 [Aureobasidium sp. EXF-8846]
MAQGVASGVVADPVDMLLYLDESAASEKTHCSVLSALDVDGYLPGSTLVVEGAVTQTIFEHSLETAILPRCEPFPGRRSIVIMDNCSTHHSEKVSAIRLREFIEIDHVRC